MNKEQLAAVVMPKMAAEITHWTAEAWEVAWTASVVSAAEMSGAGDDFAVTSEECEPLQLVKRFHKWSDQWLSKNK
jgi:hypothetical protein